jgi:hypothetical protein
MVNHIAIKKAIRNGLKSKFILTVYVDDFGRMWSKSTGNIKGDIPIREVNGQFIVDKLGGMVWNSDDGVKFVCEYRTNIDELSLAINPQTFIG